MKVPGGTPAPTLYRASLLYTKLRAQYVLKFWVRWGSKWEGSYPRTRRIPPRLGCPASAPQSTGAPGSDHVDSAAPATRPALRTSRRRTLWTIWGRTCGGSIGIPPSCLPVSRHWCFAPLHTLILFSASALPHRSIAVSGRTIGRVGTVDPYGYGVSPSPNRACTFPRTRLSILLCSRGVLRSCSAFA